MRDSNGSIYVRAVPDTAGSSYSCARGAAGPSGLVVVVVAERCGEDIVVDDCAFTMVSKQSFNRSS